MSTSTFTQLLGSDTESSSSVLRYVHRARTDYYRTDYWERGSTGRPPPLSHSSWALKVTLALRSAFLNIHRRGYNAVWLLHGWCDVKLLPSRRKFCVHYNHALVYTVTSLHCHFIRSHMRRMHVCLAVTPPSALLAEYPGSSTCYCCNTGVERIPKKIQHRKLTLEKTILPSLLQGLEPEIFRSRVRRSATEPSQLPD